MQKSCSSFRSLNDRFEIIVFYKILPGRLSGTFSEVHTERLKSPSPVFKFA